MDEGYNKSLLDELQVPEPNVNWTWSDFAKEATAIRDAFVKKGEGDGHWGVDDQSSSLYPGFQYFLRQNGKDLYTQNGKLGFAKDDLVKWFAMWADLRKAGVGRLVGTFRKYLRRIFYEFIFYRYLFCSMAAYAFARLSFVFRKFFFAVMLLTLMLPFQVTLIPQYILFYHLGWLNTYWPLILPKFLGVEGFFVFLMVQFMRNFPRELDEAGRLDGCGRIRMYWYLIIPLTVPALVTTTIFTFIWTWNDYFYISDVSLYTVSLALRQFVDATGQSSYGGLFAMSILSLVPLFILFIFFQKYLIEGITAGGIKG